MSKVMYRWSVVFLLQKYYLVTSVYKFGYRKLAFESNFKPCDSVKEVANVPFFQRIDSLNAVTLLHCY